MNPQECNYKDKENLSSPEREQDARIMIKMWLQKKQHRQPSKAIQNRNTSLKQLSLHSYSLFTSEGHAPPPTPVHLINPCAPAMTLERGRTNYQMEISRPGRAPVARPQSPQGSDSDGRSSRLARTRVSRALPSHTTGVPPTTCMGLHDNSRNKKSKNPALFPHIQMDVIAQATDVAEESTHFVQRMLSCCCASSLNTNASSKCNFGIHNWRCLRSRICGV